ncbi:MAG: hypothetical protein A2314_02235 [Elusimicrobia bacterium RIFOXYB2_FULL_50_12]|nr:MAG: hypothetical protein A2314_02235 [Elusimicrobia bacterium RIFOXYB2_FULL_50_12]
MKKIKVCHIITMLELGGAQQNTLYTLSHLNREKFAPVLITGKGGILDSEAAAMPGVETHFIRHLIRPTCPLRDIAGFFTILWLLIKIRPDIVHTHSSKAGILGRWAAYFAGVPFIVHTFHGFGFHDFQWAPVKYLYICIEWLTAKISGALIVVSTDNIVKALRHGVGRREQYCVIRSGIDVEKYKKKAGNRAEKRKELGIPADKKVIATIGPFKPQKNLEDFIAVAEMVNARRPDTAFLIIGDGAGRPRLELLIGSMERPGTVKLPGWRRDVNEILAATDIFAMTSLWEGLPRSILEAMSAGLPVVANAVDGVREIVKDGETGFLITPRDTKAMAEKLIELATNTERATAMGEKGRLQISREFDIAFMVKQQERLYLTKTPI